MDAEKEKRMNQQTLNLPFILPSDLAAEQAILGAALLDSESAALLAQSAPTIFTLEKYRYVATAIHALVLRGDPVDAVTVQSELAGHDQLDAAGGIVTLAGLLEAGATATHAETYLTTVRHLATRRELIRLGIDVSSHAAKPSNDHGDPTDLIASTITRLLALDLAADHETLMTPEQFMADHVLALPDDGFRTGFGWFDDVADGLRPGNLIVIAGRPGIGKTAMALQILYALSIQDKRPTLFISLEMSAREIGDRLVGLHVGQSSRAVRQRSIAPATLVHAYEQLERSGFHIWDAAAPTVGAVAAMIQRGVAQYHIQAVVVDHIGKVRGTRRESRALEVGEVAQALKATAKRFSVPVVALCQLNRQVEHRNSPRPQLADLRDSGNIEEEADAVLFLYTREERPENKDPHKPLEIELYLAKNRHGETGERGYLFFRALGQIKERTIREDHG